MLGSINHFIRFSMNLHLGCDKRFIPGFVHIDLADFPHIDHKHDIRSLPMIADGSVDLIYVCHALEYFDRVEVLDVLREWLRVLRPGGILRVAVPDFEAMTLVYQKYGDLGLVLGPLFGRWQIKSSSEPAFIYHRTTYDFQSLQGVLESAGFGEVRRYNWRDTIHRDYDDYSQAYIPHMDKDHGILISLNVEATKL
jgi:predicted SAM-dependent methyltransferase